MHVSALPETQLHLVVVVKNRLVPMARILIARCLDLYSL